MMAISMLAEGGSIRSIERVTGVHCDTIMRLGVRVGGACKQVMNDKMHNLKRCYGWSYGEPEQFITILELPPVNSPETAVKVGVAYQAKQGKL